MAVPHFGKVPLALVRLILILLLLLMPTGLSARELSPCETVETGGVVRMIEVRLDVVKRLLSEAKHQAMRSHCVDFWYAKPLEDCILQEPRLPSPTPVETAVFRGRGLLPELEPPRT